jgi:ribonuclease HII
MARFLGIDEAGRGCVIGPLVMCGFLADEVKLDALKKLGVKDSKLLSPNRRSFLYRKLKDVAQDYIVLEIPAADIDKLRTESNLNKIEIKHMQSIINGLSSNSDCAIIDAIESNTDAFWRKVKAGLSKELRNRITNSKFRLMCENFADRNHVVVGAASIMAKVVRDANIDKMRNEYGNFGSGYPSDPLTIKWLNEWLVLHDRFPDIVRKSWMTAKELARIKEEKTLKDFIKPYPHEAGDGSSHISAG